MKKTLTTITLAVVLALSTTFAYANDGIIVAGSPQTPPATCGSTSVDGIIVAGRAIVQVTFGIIVAGSPETQGCTETDGIIVAG
jgi:hypothetical protein